MILKVFVETVMECLSLSLSQAIIVAVKGHSLGRALSLSLTRPELTAGAPLSFFRLWHGGTTVGLVRRVPGPHL